MWLVGGREVFRYTVPKLMRRIIIDCTAVNFSTTIYYFGIKGFTKLLFTKAISSISIVKAYIIQYGLSIVK